MWGTPYPYRHRVRTGRGFSGWRWRNFVIGARAAAGGGGRRAGESISVWWVCSGETLGETLPWSQDTLGSERVSGEWLVVSGKDGEGDSGEGDGGVGV